MYEVPPFHGAKAALVCKNRIAVIRRDDIPTIPWPGRIDLPGGQREGQETPEACAARETAEEIGICIAPKRFTWGQSYAGRNGPSWLFGTDITSNEANSLRLGNEGQSCWMMEIDDYLMSDEAIPHQQAQLRDFLEVYR